MHIGYFIDIFHEILKLVSIVSYLVRLMSFEADTARIRIVSLIKVIWAGIHINFELFRIYESIPKTIFALIDGIVILVVVKWLLLVIIIWITTISSVEAHLSRVIFIATLIIHGLDFIQVQIFLMKSFVEDIDFMNIISILHFHLLVSELLIDLSVMNEISFLTLCQGDYWRSWSCSCFSLAKIYVCESIFWLSLPW